MKVFTKKVSVPRCLTPGSRCPGDGRGDDAAERRPRLRAQHRRRAYGRKVDARPGVPPAGNLQVRTDAPYSQFIVKEQTSNRVYIVDFTNHHNVFCVCSQNEAEG